MANTTQDYNDGWKAAVEQLKKMMQNNQNNKNNQNNPLKNPNTNTNGYGIPQPSSQGSGASSNVKIPKGSDGREAQMPVLNPSDAAKAQRNQSKSGQQSNQSNDQYQDGQVGQGNRPKRKEYGKMSKETVASGTPSGGFISQEEGAKIAKSEGYDDEAEVKSNTQLESDWKKNVGDAVRNEGSQGQSFGKGAIIKFLKELYYTNYDWKNELKRYIGNALSKIDDAVHWGRKKALATTGEIKKFYREADTALSDIVFFIDTSGSVGDDLYNRILAECATIVKRKGIKDITYIYYTNGIDFIETNNIVRTRGVISQEAVVRIKNAKSAGNVRGTGGTNYGLARQQADQMFKGKRIQLAMCFTDGYDTPKEMYRPKCAKNMIFVVYDNPDFEAADNSRVIRLASKDLGV